MVEVTVGVGVADGPPGVGVGVADVVPVEEIVISSGVDWLKTFSAGSSAAARDKICVAEGSNESLVGMPVAVAARGFTVTVATRVLA